MVDHRKKGHAGEVYYRNIFRDLGFSHCVTSRFGSRMYDNAKIDLINLPFNLQIKVGTQKNMSPGKELYSMGEKLIEYFPPNDEVFSKPKLLIHKKQAKQRGKYSEEIVYMSKNQYTIYKELGTDVEILFEKKGNINFPESEFKHIVAISFKDFIELIVKKFYLC